MLFKRKNEFRPDKIHSGALNQLYITPKQRRSLLKWFLMGLTLALICVVQDTMLSQLSLFNGGFDLMPALIFLACVMQDPETGSGFTLAAAVFYWCSGSAPGPYAIAFLVVLGVFFAIVRHCYLHDGFLSSIGCAAVAMMLYEIILFAVGLFLGYTTLQRLTVYLITGGLSVAAMPLFYPIINAILKSGGETWNE
jgi:hypothetical protein